MSDGGLIVVPMPHMGVSVEEGIVIAWHKAVGDEVAAEELICEIATDKVDTEVFAPADGILARIVAAAGATVPVGEPLAEMAVGPEAAARASEAVEPSPAGAAEPLPEPAANEAPAANGGGPAAPEPSADLRARVAAGHDEYGRFDPVAAAAALLSVQRTGRLVSPVARRIAADHGIDLAEVGGSGLRGRIRKADVLASVAARAGGAPAAAPVAPAPTHRMPAGYEEVPHEIVPASRVRQVIAEHMSRSRQTAAHMTTEVDVDLTWVLRARAEINRRRREAGASKLSFLPFIARATCAGLVEHPDMNSTFQGDRSIRWSAVNLGIAVDTPGGLLVPVIRNCDRLTAPAIGESIADLAERARARKLAPDDLSRGTFTLSNPGSVGAVSAPAIINQPQVAILGVPAMQRRPWVVSDELGEEATAIRSILRLAVTFDHRAIDGADATRFAVSVKQRLEDWDIEAYV